MSEYRIPEEDTIGRRRNPEEAREGVGPEPEGSEKPEGAPEQREGEATEERDA
jgi:hypothetical protein